MTTRPTAKVFGMVMTLIVFLHVTPHAVQAQPGAPQPTPLRELGDSSPFFPGVSYDAAVPTAESILGFQIGKKAASHAEIEKCLKAWIGAGGRTRLFEYAKTYEGRTLYYMVVTSPENQARLDAIRGEIAQLADPRGLSDDEGKRLVDSVPAVAWLAYSIHGNESSGSDAALALLYHLSAATGPEVEALLRDTIVLIDPMMNPDGRDRFIKQVAETRGTAPNLDDQSLLHAGWWPWGRMNHYLFDLNRDWILGVNPESRGRIQAAGAWNPLLFVDAHEMGSQESYLFSPQREPANPHRPKNLDRWSELFGKEQSQAFDAHGWPYYTGEWNEGWYPGYSDAWAGFRGAVGVLYEQASVDEDGVRRPGGDILSYREAVQHHVVSSMANLHTLQANAHEIKSEFLAGRRAALSKAEPYGKRTIALLPTANRTRLHRFLELMQLQDIEMHVAGEAFAADGVDQLGRRFRGREIPAGTILISNRQPLAHLIGTILEFDTPMPEEYLRRERQELLRSGETTIYDQTAWNLIMLHGLESVTLNGDLPESSALYMPSDESAAAMSTPSGTIAWIIDGLDDASVVAAARLLEQGVEVRVVDRPIDLGGHSFSRGSVVITRYDNRRRDEGWEELVEQTAQNLSLQAVGITEGLGDGELPDIGGGHFIRLEPPRIALAARGGVSPYDFGSIWHMLDTQFAIRHSHLDEDFLDDADLRRYNVLVLPSRWFGVLSEDAWAPIKSWVEAGGTLIAIGGSAEAIASEEKKLSSVRRLRDALEELDSYELAVRREWMAKSGELPDGEKLWSHVPSATAIYPWESGEDAKSRPEADALKKQDLWDRTFMPQGAFLAARTDDRHWLTFGCGESIPILYNTSNVLMAGTGVEAPIRMGVFDVSSEGEDEVSRVGWAAIPAGHEMRLRMSGLLWPEAAQRIANGAWVTRERLGNGQVILFATAPNFRGTTFGTARVLANAMIYGPGVGASPAIRP